MDSLTCDHLAGDWRIWQRRRGHRWSTDDLLVAWLAARTRPDARRMLDLGAGIGSVGLLTLWRLGGHLTMLEAQEESHALALRTIRDNGLDVTALRGDLRDPDALPAGERWPLVTGSPPYFPTDRGRVSPDPQRAACRMELRGTVADYARAAARVLTPDGAFVWCFPAADPRGESAAAEAGLHLRSRRIVYFRADQPLLALYVATPAPGAREEGEPIHVRGADGRWTDAWVALRAEMGTVVVAKAPGGRARPAG